MKVLYEGSVAGNAHREQKNKGGVFRVVDSLLTELFKRSDIATYVNSYEKNTSREDMLAYLQHKGQSETPLYPYYYPIQKEIAEKEKEIARLSAEIEKKAFPFKQLAFPLKNAFKKNVSRLEDLNAMPLMEKGKFDIYHSPYFAIPSGIRADSSVKTFWTSYDLIPILFPQHFEETTIEEVRTALHKLDKESWVLCISESTRNDLLNYLGDRIDAQKVFVTPLAASDDFYKVTDKLQIQHVISQYGIPKEEPYILSLCTLEPRKNITHTIKAFSKMIREEKIQNLNLVLAGAKGWKFDAIFQEIETSEEVKKRIFITGFVKDQDLAYLYSGAKMFVYPSIYEGFGLPPLEAMQCGVPVITSNTSSLPEVVGTAGIMVEPLDQASLISEMLSLYKDDQKWQRMSALALQKSAEFTWAKTCDETILSYKKAI